VTANDHSTGELIMRIKGLAVLVTLLCGAALNATASLTIINAGFEDTVTGSATYGTTIPGWGPITGDIGGVWRIAPYSPAYWNSPTPPEGNQVGWLSVGPSGNPVTVAQTLTSLVEAGATYTFSGYVGHPIGFGASRNPATQFTVAIMAGSAVVASLSGTGPEGSFAPFSVSWTGDSEHAGQLLGIQLGSSQAQTAFDKLAIVPEPTTIIAGALLLLPFGASTLRILRRKA
jgi:hypothetical protein